MRAPWLLALAACAAGSVASAQPAQPGQAGPLSVGHRQPFAFLLGTPTGEGGRTSSSELIRTVSDLLRARTNLELEILDPSLMRTCRGRLVCLSLKARKDYDRSALLDERGRPLPFREHVRRLREAGTAYPKYLFVLSNVTLSGQADRMSAVLVNTDLALGYYHAADRDAPDWEDATEAKVNSAAVVSPPERAQVAGPEEARAFLEQLFESRFERAFRSTGNWEPYGTIELTGTAPGAIVYVDGEPIGAAQPDVTRVERVDPGLREVRVELAEHLPDQVEVRVRRGETASARVELAPKPRVGSAVPRTVTMWTGAALFAAGVGITIYGATRPQSDLRTYCIDGPGGDCAATNQFVTFGYDPEAPPREINPSGVLVVPLGYSLAGAGAAFGLGGWLSAEDDLPWIPWVVGLVVGATAYGVSAAVAGP